MPNTIDNTLTSFSKLTQKIGKYLFSFWRVGGGGHFSIMVYNINYTVNIKTLHAKCFRINIALCWVDCLQLPVKSGISSDWPSQDPHMVY